MTARLGRILAIAIAGLTAPAIGQESLRKFHGPIRYCGYTFAIDLQADEYVVVEKGPDFLLEGLVSQRGGYGLYEGFAPQDGTGEKKIDAGLGKPTYQIGKSGGDVSYVMWTGTKSQPFYVHVWGQAFKGDKGDFRLLRRMQFGDAAKRGCATPTPEQERK